MADTPFSRFAPPLSKPTPLRAAITSAYRRSEPVCITPLLEMATLPDNAATAAVDTARGLIEALRAKRRGSGVEGLVQEYALSSNEGVALMCLAEALLRIPDKTTRDALIRDKIAKGDWKSHVGSERSIFVNAASWGLLITGQLVGEADKRSLGAVLNHLLARVGAPVIRRAVDTAMRMMGGQFVMGQTIGKALSRARRLEKKGYSYSYDMLGEAATTSKDAERYYTDYEAAIHAIGGASAGQGIHDGPGISIKLSALHPRYARAQADRVMAELLPRVKELARLAKNYRIGFNIDAEEADRLELSLDLLEMLALDPDLAGWDGLGFVVQAYSRRCPFVTDWLIDLAHRSNRRIMVRLVKGAYWDAEIKHAQVDGLSDFPVYTRKIHTDVAYIACARKLLNARGVLFPQFATHNALTLATIHEMAGPDFKPGDWEFQCLHGMGEALYEEVVGAKKLDRPCRIYAPVGSHETLLAYLVRRLLENGANSSFVNRIGDPDISVEDLVADPVTLVLAATEPGAPHALIAQPAHMYGARLNASGIDLSDESSLQSLSKALVASSQMIWKAEPAIAVLKIRCKPLAILNPADNRDIVGTASFALPRHAVQAVKIAADATTSWSATPVAQRAAILDCAADMIQERMPILLGLIVREAGKSVPNAIAEVREAIDFLRYYAARAKEELRSDTQALGPVVCISPWNFPLAIFTGQIAAALAAGNAVLAKPAEETPLIAAEAVRMLHKAGVPKDVLQFVPGDGSIGAALVGAPETAAVMFTGSTQVARLIQAQLASRLSLQGKPIPLIAETGGQNAMIVDSSALAEQVVADVTASAFDSAGQRCSALRILCLQEEIADSILEMLQGAMNELRLGNPDQLAVDIGPVITAEAKGHIEQHIETMRAHGRTVKQIALPEEAQYGTFVPPTIIELQSIDELEQEIFGPVLHVIRYRSNKLDYLIDAINATGYGLTFGLHTRLDETIAKVSTKLKAGNLYINRNVIGAVVGVQPFGGRGLSGTGPKAGGPHYLRRLICNPLLLPSRNMAHVDPALFDFAKWLEACGEEPTARLAFQLGAMSPLGVELKLPGPVGELNIYSLRPRGTILLQPLTRTGLFHQIAAALATGNDFALQCDPLLYVLKSEMPPSVRQRMRSPDSQIAGELIEGEGERVTDALQALAERPGGVVLAQSCTSVQMHDVAAYRLEWLLDEVSTSVDTTAAGGNASLMALD